MQIFGRSALNRVLTPVREYTQNLKAPPHAADPNIEMIGRQGHIIFFKAPEIYVKSVEKMYKKNIKHQG